MLGISAALYDEMVAHCLRLAPEEACGLFGGDPSTGRVTRLFPIENLAHSAKVYHLDPKGHLHADRVAEDDGGAIIGVFHSHTHTEAYPSPTDVAQAPDPSWHYAIVSLRDVAAMTRSFRIVDGEVAEEQIVVG